MSNELQPKPKEDINLLRRSVRDTWLFIKQVMFRLTHLADDTDVDGTISSIRDGVVLEGSNLWVLICSVMIASIGLDVNSPAVIIGAMLISPLMSPILGIGLSIGMNDRETLGKSLRNFGLAIVLSMLTAWIYFKITPFGDFTDEMKARIEPTLLDVFVAFFGGLAGIVAGSRNEKTNAIPGVAIATALMPPLCTASYGLAVGRLEIFGGAFYLFFINAVFISISTYIIVRFLKFPVVERASNRRVAFFTKMLVYTVLFLLMMPSLWFLGRKLQENFFTQSIKTFVHDNFNKNTDQTSVQWTYLPYNEQDSVYQLRILSFGAGRYINQDSLMRLQKQFNTSLNNRINWMQMGGYDSCVINLIQTDRSQDAENRKWAETRTSLLTEMEEKFRLELGTYEKKDAIIVNKDKEIARLNARIVEIKGDTIPFYTLKKELKVLFPDMKEIALAKAAKTNFNKDTLSYLAVVEWQGTSLRSRRERDKNKGILNNFLQVKLNTKAVEVVDYK